MKEPEVIPLTGHSRDGTPHDPFGLGTLYREPGKDNAHIGRIKREARRFAMAAKDKTEDASIVSDRFIEGEPEKTYSVGKVDPLTSSHFTDSKEPRFGVTVDEGPVPVVDEDGKRAIEKARAAERAEAAKAKVYPDKD